MLFHKRRHKRYGYYRYYTRLNLYAKLAIFIIFITIISTIIEFINKNKATIVPLIIMIIVSLVAYKPIFKVVKRYIDYRQFGGVNLSKPQLIALLCSLSPRQFEVFCSELFRVLGNDVQLTAEGCDGGKDVIVNKSIYVECKRYNTNMIGREICQKLLGAVEADKMEKGIIFTNGKIHDNAKEMLKKTNRLELWDVNKIFEVFNSLENYKASLVLDTALQYKDESTVFNDLNPQVN